MGQLLPPPRLLLDQADVEQRGGVALLHLQQPLDDAPARGAGVPAGSEPGGAGGAALDRDAAPVLALLLIRLLAPQRHGHAGKKVCRDVPRLSAWAPPRRSTFIPAGWGGIGGCGTLSHDGQQ